MQSVTKIFFLSFLFVLSINYMFPVFLFVCLFVCLFFLILKGQGEGEQVNQHGMEDNEEHGGEGGKNLSGVS